MAKTMYKPCCVYCPVTETFVAGYSGGMILYTKKFDNARWFRTPKQANDFVYRIKRDMENEIAEYDDDFLEGVTLIDAYGNEIE